MENGELNVVLYYADFLSLKKESIPITDTCKYFFVYGYPVNAAFIAGVKPIWDEQNQYYQQAESEYAILKESLGEEAAASFIDDIAHLKACGAVGAIQMLKCIHRYSDKRERKQAFEKYFTWKNNQHFTHIIKDDDGTPTEKECSKYVYHFENMRPA